MTTDVEVIPDGRFEFLPVRFLVWMDQPSRSLYLKDSYGIYSLLLLDGRTHGVYIDIYKFKSQAETINCNMYSINFFITHADSH